ncbi:HNH endonuclease [Paenibacillus sp. MZ04-78.2]|uniref:HNH endonuclease signature motif containing protein n=1 Tax=Paenibacillus sp. MZ04-78.2 TaxID=2962034 RepID=UPI0020B6D167|nr:HNH endonuclease signature motif containing protein [Paenibacillus sp. MZ04-78.2]MCP3772745.1 HNH endonuclease [Paenibacillus sp. MZ04-78.2]
MGIKKFGKYLIPAILSLSFVFSGVLPISAAVDSTSNLSSATQLDNAEKKEIRISHKFSVVYDKDKAIEVVEGKNGPAKSQISYMDADQLSDKLSASFLKPNDVITYNDSAKEHSVYNLKNVGQLNTEFSTTSPSSAASGGKLGSGVSVAYYSADFVITGNSSPYLEVTLTGVEGNLPATVGGQLSLSRGINKIGNYTVTDVLNYTWQYPFVGKSERKNVSVNDTSFYWYQSSNFAIWRNPDGSTAGYATDGNQTTEILLNKLGVLYPFWYGIDVNGFLNSFPPDTTTYSRVSPSTVDALRKAFENSVRDKYKTYYDKKYGYVNWQPGIEIHHIRPLNFGGDNSFENLIPLYADKHYQFSNWWNYYQ